jgi:hypothetical protein
MTNSELDYNKAAAYISRSVLATFLTAIVISYLMQSKFEKVSWEYDGDTKNWWLSLGKTVLTSISLGFLMMWMAEKEVTEKIINKVK